MSGFYSFRGDLLSREVIAMTPERRGSQRVESTNKRQSPGFIVVWYDQGEVSCHDVASRAFWEHREGIAPLRKSN